MGNTEETKKKKNKNVSKPRKQSIKWRLIVLPLLVILVVISIIGVRSSILLRDSLLEQMRGDGVEIANQAANQLEMATISIDTVNDTVEKEIRTVARSVISEQEEMSNEKLIEQAEILGVQEINIFDEDGEVIYSTFSENLGYVVDDTHSSYPVLSGEREEFMEEIRQSITSDDYYKYGYVSSPTGDVIQVGVLANVIHELSEDFSYQNTVEALAEEENIVYALFSDKSLTAVAHSNQDRIGLDLSDDQGAQTAAGEGEIYTSEYFYEAEDIDVYDVLVPVVVEGEHIGAINLGLSMENVYGAVSDNTLQVGILGVISFAIIGGILFFLSNNVIKVITDVKEQLNGIASGDLTGRFSEKRLGRKDEFGEMIRSIVDMQDSIKAMIEDIAHSSQQLATSSEQLTATSEQSATAAGEVAKTIEEMAGGAGNQAEQTEEGAQHINQLGTLIELDLLSVEHLNQSAEKVNQLKNEGLEILRDLVEKSNSNNQSTKEVYATIVNTNESAEKIESASQMIKSIAEQTNLLALNAAIEAARAGESGKGFAVVAEEIRKLAEQSNTFTEEIGGIIGELTNETGNAVATMEKMRELMASQTKSVEQTNDKFTGIDQAVIKMRELVTEVNQSGKQMEGKKDEIIQIIESLSAIAQQNAAGSQEASASVEEQTASMVEIANASESLSRLSEEMQKSTLKFKY